MDSATAYSGLGLGVDSTIVPAPTTADTSPTSVANTANSTTLVSPASTDEEAPPLEAAGPRLLFSVDTKNMILSEQDRANLMRFKTWWDATERRNRRGQFRLMDLPTELRALIYGDAIFAAAPFGESLQEFSLPSITLVSRLVRKESLPLFFSETSFYMDVESDFGNRKQHRIDGRDYSVSGNRSAGQPRIPNKVRKLFASAGPNALLHDITIKVHGTWQNFNKNRCCDQFVVSYIQLKVVKRILQVTTKIGPDHPVQFLGSRDLQFDTEDVNAGLKPAVKEAGIIGKKKSFKGLTLSHIQQIVQKLRFQR